MVPEKTRTESASSAACKLARWYYEDRGARGERGEDEHDALLHHADWLAYQLHGKMGMSDFNNALKLGFDPDPSVEAFEMVERSPFGYMLPKDVRAPGTSFGAMRKSVIERFAFSPTCEVIAGTTDSVAAFVALVGASKAK